MSSNPVQVGIVGLGRWASVLTRAAKKSDKLQIVAGFSRSAEKRTAFAAEMGVPAAPDMATLLADPEIKGVILTVPNEQHLPMAEMVAKAGKHVYTEKPIANTLIDGLRIAALEEKYGVSVTVGHSARLMAGIRMIKEKIDAGELGRVAFFEANFSNERALELTPKAWRWYKDRAPGGPLSQLAIHQFDVLHYLGGEILEASTIASKLSPVGAEVDDQSMTMLRFADGKLGYVGSSWTSPGSGPRRAGAEVSPACRCSGRRRCRRRGRRRSSPCTARWRGWPAGTRGWPRWWSSGTSAASPRRRRERRWA